MTRKFIVLSIAFLAFSGGVSAQESDDESEVVSLNATITGNQEQPTVMYIVPWKPATDDSILYQPLKRQIKSVFEHIERPEHEREVKYLKMMAGE